MVDNFGRVDWNTLWMSVAFCFSQKSIDPSTKHGCCIIDKNNNFLSMGYNGFPRDCLDNEMPLTRPEKYAGIIHAEENCIINAKKDLTGGILYVSGMTCSKCFSKLLNAGVSKIIYGPINSHCLTDEDYNLINLMNISKKTGKHKIEIIKYEDICEISEIYEFLDVVKKYIKEKTDNA